MSLPCGANSTMQNVNQRNEQQIQDLQSSVKILNKVAAADADVRGLGGADGIKLDYRRAKEYMPKEAFESDDKGIPFEKFTSDVAAYLDASGLDGEDILNTAAAVKVWGPTTRDELCDQLLLSMQDFNKVGKHLGLMLQRCAQGAANTKVKNIGTAHGLQIWNSLAKTHTFPFQ